MNRSCSALHTCIESVTHCGSYNRFGKFNLVIWFGTKGGDNRKIFFASQNLNLHVYGFQLYSIIKNFKIPRFQH